MYKPVKIYALVQLILFLLASNLEGQTISSPYSAFGLGYIENRATGSSIAMGGTGIGFLSDRSINIMNPASYSGIDSLVSIFELGLFGKYTSFKSREEKQSAVNANLKYITMGFRINPWLATSFGFAPYSSIGYDINTVADVEGSNLHYDKKFTGEGGVNQVYLGASVRLVRNLSVGVNAAYLFGNVTKTESSVSYNYALENITYVSNLNFDYGLNYGFAAKKLNFNIGLIYGASKSLKTNTVSTITTGTLSQTVKGTIRKFSIPQHYGAGIAVSKDYFKAGFDYERSMWNEVSFDNPLLQTRNSNRFSAGVEFPSQGIRKGTGGMIFYRFGCEYRDSYLVIENTPVNYASISFGTGIPLKGILSVINISAELGQNGTITKGLFRETFCTLHLDLALWDLWFKKRMFE
jgi:hypothetical protein